MTWKPSLVTLIDGRQVLSDSEEWRHECFARHIANMPTIQQRREMIARTEKKAGSEAAEKLKKTIRDLWYSTEQKG